MGFRLTLFLFLASLPVILTQEITHAEILVDGTQKVAETDDSFICATLDWWPHDKCNYNQCPWGYTSVTNLDLSRPLLAKAIKAFKPLRIRVGGSLQDQVLYDVGSNTGAILTFGLNALHGRHKSGKNAWAGDWDVSNAHAFINYTISKGYHIDSWEFGNELSGSGIGASVGAEQYAKDLKKLKNIINKLYIGSYFKPPLVAPGGFFDQEWFAKLLQVSGSDVVNVVTHHIYNLGPGNDPNLVSKILNPQHLSKVSRTFINLEETIQQNGPWASVWIGESGGAFNSGGHNVSNTFVNSFWYLDQLGMSSNYSTKVYCRQTLVGGNYGLLDKTTFTPNPDYYSALLWHRLIGKGVLSVGTNASPFLRTYAHCSKGREGLTLLLINLSNQTGFIINIENSMNLNKRAEANSIRRENSFFSSLKKTVSWIGSKASDVSLREEYHLTPKDGYLQSRTMVLNGIPLELTSDGEIPELDPVLNEVKSPLYIAPLSIAFIVLPNFDAPACV
ncbi:Heparanase-like protein [Quillaja saponaria]|uniref:Heparanase-like protein n=1 Tax=Quillaja saponaria TaxID=32244 RepID=A0AAD7QBI3_QUISA|nr:Heparanase-like protein [Quillaja saponaria]